MGGDQWRLVWLNHVNKFPTKRLIVNEIYDFCQYKLEQISCFWLVKVPTFAAGKTN